MEVTDVEMESDIAFNVLDRDSDGSITFNDLGLALSFLSSKFSEPIAKGLAADTNGDFAFSFSEFFSLMTSDTTPPASACTCGNVAGAGLTEHPWLVAIWLGSGDLLCTGSLLNLRTVLTSAACVEQYTPSLLRVLVSFTCFHLPAYLTVSFV